MNSVILYSSLVLIDVSALGSTGHQESKGSPLHELHRLTAPVQVGLYGTFALRVLFKASDHMSLRLVTTIAPKTAWTCASVYL